MPLLRIDIEARVAQFQDAMTSIERSAKKSAGGIASAFRSTTAALAGLGVGISAGALTAIIKQAIDAADHLNDLSKRTGVAVDVLGGLGFAATQAGGDLEGIASASDKLNKSIASAAAGNKEFSAAFAALKIDVREANGQLKTVDKVMVELANRFEQYADGPEKVAIATRLLGKAGADQIALLNEGGRSLQANIEMYRRYAGVTQETAQRADAFNDNLAKLSLIAGSFGRQLAAELLPSLEGVSRELLRAKENGEGFKTWAERGAGVIKVLGGAAVAQAQTLDELTTRLGGVVEQSKALANLDFSKFIEESKKIRERLDGISESYGRMRGAIKNGGQADPFAKPFGTAEKMIGDEQKLLETRQKMLQKYNNEGALSDKEFYAARDAAYAESIANQKSLLNAEIAVLMAKKQVTKDAKEQAEIQAQIDEIVAKRSLVGHDKPRAPTIAGPGTDDGGAKALEGRLREYERNSEREKALLSKRLDYLQIYYQQDLLSINDYYQARQAAANEAFQNQAANIDKEIALLEEHKPKNDSERASNASKVKELKEKRAQLEQQAILEATKGEIERTAAAKAFAGQLTDINQRLLEQQGFFEKAAGTNFDQQTADLRADLRTEIEAASASGNSGRALQLEGFQKKLNMLRDMAVAQGRLNELQEVESRIQSELSIATSRAEVAAKTGAVTELQALRQVSDARAQAAIDVAAVAEAFAEAAERSADPRFIQRANEMRQQAKELAATADLVRDKFQDVFESGFESFIDKLVSGTATIKDAFKSLFSEIASDLSKIAIKDLGKQLFSKEGALGGVVDFTSQLFGGASKSPVASIADAAGAAGEVAARTASTAALTSLAAVTTATDATMVTLAATTVATDTALLALTASATAAATALTAAAAAAAGKAASDGAGGLIGFFGDFASVAAKGNIYAAGNVIPFAKGGVPGIVDSPTFFAMAGGRTGLMGEAGAEAIMPLQRDKQGGLAVSMVGQNGEAILLPLTRDRAGKLAVRSPDGKVREFALGAAFSAGALAPIFTTNAATAISRQPIGRGAMASGLMAPVEPASKGDTYIDVHVPPGTSRESASSVANRTAMEIARANRRNG